jgi:hypothetical protein
MPDDARLGSLFNSYVGVHQLADIPQKEACTNTTHGGLFSLC